MAPYRKLVFPTAPAPCHIGSGADVLVTERVTLGGRVYVPTLPIARPALEAQGLVEDFSSQVTQEGRAFNLRATGSAIASACTAHPGDRPVRLPQRAAPAGPLRPFIPRWPSVLVPGGQRQRARGTGAFMAALLKRLNGRAARILEDFAPAPCGVLRFPEPLSPVPRALQGISPSDLNRRVFQRSSPEGFGWAGFESSDTDLFRVLKVADSVSSDSQRLCSRGSHALPSRPWVGGSACSALSVSPSNGPHRGRDR